MKTQFEIVSEIKSKGRPRATFFEKGNKRFAKMYTPKDTFIYENLVKTEYRNQCGTIFYENGLPLIVEIKAYFSIPESKKSMYPQVACTKNKDLDNIAKIILDGLNGIAFDDDKQIVKLIVSKEYTTERERVVVTLERDQSFSSEEEIKSNNKIQKLMKRLDVINAKLTNPKLTEKVRKDLEDKKTKLEEEMKSI
jgi:Holliday junction resolvase RusA-like endonuclease